MDTSVLQYLAQNLGYTVTATSDNSVKIKLPLFCSLQVIRRGDEDYNLIPYFGFFTRTAATWMTLIIDLLFVASIVLTDSISKYDFAVLALLIMSMVWDIYRYILTEGTMTRIYCHLVNSGAT